MYKENKWSDFKKWRMDILKSIILFAVLAVLTALVVEGYNIRRDARAARTLKDIDSIKQLAIDFEKATYLYYGDAYDAFLEKAQLTGGYSSIDKTYNIRQYEDVSYDQWNIAREKIKRKTSKLKKLLDDVEKKQSQ